MPYRIIIRSGDAASLVHVYELLELAGLRAVQMMDDIFQFGVVRVGISVDTDRMAIIGLVSEIAFNPDDLIEEVLIKKLEA